MNSDIILEGSQVKVNANDIVLDFPARRKDKNGQRRAFVHDFEDGLTINWAGDYPGGVKIQGHVLLDHTVYVKNTATFEKAIAAPDLFIGELKTTGSLPVRVPGTGGLPGKFIDVPFQIGESLVAIIKDLRKQVNELQNKVAALERK